MFIHLVAEVNKFNELEFLNLYKRNVRHRIFFKKKMKRLFAKKIPKKVISGIIKKMGRWKPIFSPKFSCRKFYPPARLTNLQISTSSEKLQAVAPPLRAYKPTNFYKLLKKLQAVAPPLRGSRF